MLHTADHKVGTVYHATIADSDSRLWVCYGRFCTHLNIIIIVKILLFVVTVLRFHVRQDESKMGISATVTADSSLDCCGGKQIKIFVPSDPEVNMKDLLLKCLLRHSHQNINQQYVWSILRYKERCSPIFGGHRFLHILCYFKKFSKTP